MWLCLYCRSVHHRGEVIVDDVLSYLLIRGNLKNNFVLQQLVISASEKNVLKFQIIQNQTYANYLHFSASITKNGFIWVYFQFLYVRW